MEICPTGLPLLSMFDATVAHMVRDRLWHPSQRLVEEKDGSVTLSFQAGGRMEIVAWVLSYGRHAEVLAPAELRAEVAHQVQEMASRYAP